MYVLQPSEWPAMVIFWLEVICWRAVGGEGGGRIPTGWGTPCRKLMTGIRLGVCVVLLESYTLFAPSTQLDTKKNLTEKQSEIWEYLLECLNVHAEVNLVAKNMAETIYYQFNSLMV